MASTSQQFNTFKWLKKCAKFKQLKFLNFKFLLNFEILNRHLDQKSSKCLALWNGKNLYPDLQEKRPT